MSRAVQEVREDTGKVRIYNDKKSLAKPALYRCSGTNCDSRGSAQRGPNAGGNDDADRRGGSSAGDRDPTMT